MKIFFTVFAFLISCTQAVQAQDTTKILFIGNSFTGANDLQGIVHQFYDADKLPVVTAAYAPGGITVGDLEMGPMAHMNNPEVYKLIRSNEWDFLVLQDNQGRFALDSAIFPSTTKSKVVEGHIKIRDSFHHYHPCAKMVWFSGWGFKDEDTSMIRKITVNYEVLNDSAKDVIAPIGYAWKKSIIARPELDLWSPDGAHPDMKGSFLTGAVIYGTLTQKNVVANPLMMGMAPTDATHLKTMAQGILSDAAIKRKSNLNGVLPLAFTWDKTNLKAPAGKAIYRWYANGKMVKSSADSVFKPTVAGNYKLWTKDKDGFWLKSCTTAITIKPAGTAHTKLNDLLIYPNPATDKITLQHLPGDVASLGIYSVEGKQQVLLAREAADMAVDISNLVPGNYVLTFFNAEKMPIGQSGIIVKQ
jgi:hypothetical protein